MRAFCATRSGQQIPCLSKGLLTAPRSASLHFIASFVRVLCDFFAILMHTCTCCVIRTFACYGVTFEVKLIILFNHSQVL